MTKSLQEYKDELEEINTKLSQPETLSNSPLLQELSQKSSELTQIIEVASQLEKFELQLKESKELLDTETSEEMSELISNELVTLEEKITSKSKELKLLTVEKDPDDKRNAILEIRAGTGGEEAALFASDLYRMYARYSENKGWKLEQITQNKTGNGGYKEIIVMISGNEVFGHLRYENGVHRVQRIPETESSGRIHTSAVSIVVLPEVDDVNIEVKDEDIKIDVYRSSGPGGQSVNTTDSAVRITHLPTNIVVTCQDEKSQHKNKARAMSILKSKLYEIEVEKQQAKQSNLRKSAIKSGDRSAKIRTYNYPQSRITDHRIKKSWYNLEGILNGDINDIISSLQEAIADEA